MANVLSMRIFVKLVMGRGGSHFCDLRDFEGVQGLRAAIYRIRGIPLERQRLTFAGEQLEDGRLLSYYGIVDESVVALSDSLTIQVTLQQFGGDSLVRVVEVSPLMQLDELRFLAGQLVDRGGISELSLALVVGDERYNDMGDTLSDCNCVDGTVVTILEI